MHNLEQQPLQDNATVTEAGAEQPVVPALEGKQKTEKTSEKAKQASVWRYSILGGTVLLVFAIIFASVFSTSHQARTPKVSKRPVPTSSLPVSQPLSIPAPTTTPLQTSGASSHSLSTSLVDGIAYIGTVNNAVYALRMSDGRVLWQQQIDGAVDQPPLVFNGVVYVNSFVGQNGPDYIYALQANDGRVLWRFISNDNNLTSNNYTYLSSTTGASNALYLVSQTGISALQVSSGKILWHVATQGTGDSMPIVDNGVVYATSSADGKPGTLEVLRASDGKLLWQHTEGNYISVSLISKGVVYITSNGAVTALRASNGSTLWQRAIAADIIQPLQLVNGIIYTSGTKITLPPAALYIPSTQRVRVLSELTRTTPARPAMPLKEGTSTVYAIQANNGTVLWHYPLLNGANSWTGWLSAQNSVVYVSAAAETNGAPSSGEIYALQSQSGAMIWHDKIQASPDSALFTNGVIYLSVNNDAQNSAVYALRADTGGLLWSYPISGYTYNAPLLVGTVLYVGSDNGVIYALHAANGALLWHYQTNVGA